MIPSFVRPAIIGAALLVGGCGASAAPVSIAVEVPTTAETEPTSGLLTDFFPDDVEPSAPSVETPAPEQDHTEPAVMASPEPVPTEPQEAVSADSPADEQGDELPGELLVEEEATVASIEQISVLPSTVPAAGVQSLEITGSGYAPAAEVLIVTCVIPGEPILRSAAADVVNARLAALDATDDCAIDQGVRVIVDGQGQFSAQLSGSIETNSMVYAADLAVGQGAYVLVPISQ